MGNCIAGGGYLPVLCDKLLMTEGSGLYIACRPLSKLPLVKLSKVKQLGGARMACGN